MPLERHGMSQGDSVHSHQEIPALSDRSPPCGRNLTPRVRSMTEISPSWCALFGPKSPRDAMMIAFRRITTGVARGPHHAMGSRASAVSIP